MCFLKAELHIVIFSLFAVADGTVAFILAPSQFHHDDKRAISKKPNLSSARLKLTLQLDTTLVASSSSALDSSVFAGLSSLFNGQQSVFITITRPSTTTTSSSSSSPVFPGSTSANPSPAPTAVPTESPSPPNPTSTLPADSSGSPSGFSTGIYTLQMHLEGTLQILIS